MRRILRAMAILVLCLTTPMWFLPAIASAETDFRTLYANFLSGQQGQNRARRAVALIDLAGDGTPELAQLSSVSGDSRTCRLTLYTVKSG